MRESEQAPARHLHLVPSHELLPADPVYDGELVDDPAPTPVPFTSWWQRSRHVPAAFRSRPVGQAARDAAAWLLRCPWRLVGSVARGAVLAVRRWRSWVRVRDYREAAEQAEKLADKFTEIRALTLFRWKVTAVTLAASLVIVATLSVVFGSVVWSSALAASAVVLAIAGRRTDGSPGRKAVLAGPRTLTWTMDPQVLVDAFRDAKLIGKDETLRLVQRASRQGEGWAITVDLPATRKAADVLRHREALASALAVDEVQLIVERVRGSGGHAGRVALWVADRDPYATPPLPSPLVQVERWDAWRPIPFGRDARNRPIVLPLVWTSLLVGAIPRQGKTFATRLPAAGLILDPYTRVYVFDGKGGKDWDAARQVAHRFVCGDELEQAEAVRDHLIELVAEVQARYARMATLDDVVCPESKITPELSRDPTMGMPITAVILDEVQVYLENPTRQVVGGTKTTLGAHIADLLTYLAKKGPAAGIVVIAATQRPDSTTIPSRLRAVLGSRFALRVMDWRDSNIILGEQMNTRGYDSSTLLPGHKGVGILRPDGDTQAGTDVLAVTVRTYYMPNDQWRQVCERGRELREQVGTLSGYAAGDHATRVVDPASVLKALGGTTGERAPLELPQPLRAVVRYLGDELDRREFVPTAELVEALGVEPTAFGRQMAEIGCQSTRQRVEQEDGSVRQVRGYLTADIRAVIDGDRAGPPDDG